ncbi:Gfo/Idh/MocA family protein [Paenibacillus aceris]|uniref:Dehydrogenase n=1 Tax=Paenibacillus aceris TaxID=869555 RepID=A0ABS4I696_9BACL|nr:Gfo/Idh/MocA family oxidoreductase [Paenibacillus aceris]MBP1966433.1 putative dehydrogenase [Paenibacillus aceris]NHW39585.1 Gfo/Idh/MocA family oxidoreductase [Paenibacillus aceris]
MKLLTSALVGTGGIADWLHVPIHKKLRGSELKWVCDTNAQVAKEFAEKWNVPNWTDRLKDVLADTAVDWVDVAVPNRFHEQVTIQSLEAGKHVLCQKPMADSIMAAQRMISAADKSARNLGIYMCFRGDPAFRMMKRMIAEGAFGSIISFRGKMISGNGKNLRAGQWRMDDASGALDLLGIHLIDLFAWLHSDIQWVQAYSNTLYATMKGDDVTTAIYGLKDGVTAVLETTYCSYSGPDMPIYLFEVNGTAGYASYNFDIGKLVVQLKEGYQSEMFSCKPNEVKNCTIEHALNGGGSIANVHQDFVDSILRGEAFEADGQVGMKSIHVIEITRFAAKERRQIMVLQ